MCSSDEKTESDSPQGFTGSSIPMNGRKKSVDPVDTTNEECDIPDLSISRYPACKETKYTDMPCTSIKIWMHTHLETPYRYIRHIWRPTTVIFDME